MKNTVIDIIANTVGRVPSRGVGRTSPARATGAGEFMNAAAPAAHGLTLSQSHDLDLLRQAIDDALDACEHATTKCLIAGQMLNDRQQTLEHGQFKPWIEKHLPRISYDTASRWARAAANICKYVPAPATIDVSISDVLRMPEKELTPETKKYKQAWLDFTSEKTINDCLQKVLVGGAPGVTVDRVLNGKFAGGTNHHDNRKDFPLFTGVALTKLSGHLNHWKSLTDLQRSEIEQLFRAAIHGQATTLPRKLSRSFPFGKKASGAVTGGWPDDLVRLLFNICRQRLKGGTDDE